MVSWTCDRCGGSGREKITVVRRGDISTYTGVCGACQGGGSIRNGKAEYKAHITNFRWDE